MDPNQAHSDTPGSRKKRRGHYKLYLDPATGVFDVPRSTMYFRRKAAEREANAQHCSAGKNSVEAPFNMNMESNEPDDDPREGSNAQINVIDSEGSSETEEGNDSDTENIAVPCDVPEEDMGGEESDGKQKDYIQKYNLNEKLYGTLPHSRLEVLLMVLHMAIRHCHTHQFIQDQILFVNSLFGVNVLDISYHVFKCIFPSASSIERHYFCDQCVLYVGSQRDLPVGVKTVDCHLCKKIITVNSVQSKNYFITLSIKDQIENLLKRPDVKLIPREHRQEGVIRDIFDGEIYRKFSQLGCHNNNFLTCTFNTDGVQVFESSEQGSLYPILLHLNEIVPEVRFKMENLILGGLWCGRGAPNMALFMKPFVKELLELSETGVKVLQPGGGLIEYPVFAIAASVDSVTKPKLLCQRQFNGGYSCLYCYHPNDASVDDIHKNQKHFDTAISYPLRTEEEVVKDMVEADSQERAGQLRSSSVRGFLGISILLMFSKIKDTCNFNPFHIVWSVVIDYMHLLEGLGSNLITFYKSILSDEQMEIVNNRLQQITLPQGTSRRPRCISDRVKYKAKEFRSFFLYFAVPCFEDLLPARHFNNLKLFVNTLHVLLGDNISESVLHQLKSDVTNFAIGFQGLYGLRNVTYNLHIFTHLADLVTQVGPIWCYSNFIFESGNGLLVKLVRGTRSVINEISIKFTRLQTAFQCINNNHVSNETLEFCNNVLGSKFTKSEKYDDVSATGSYSFTKVTVSDKALLMEHDIPVVNDTVKVLNRVVRAGCVFTSHSYCRARATNDSCVVLRDNSYATLDKIVASADNVLKCLVRPIRVAANSNLLPSIKKCSFDVYGPSVVINFSEISRKCVLISFDTKHFICHIPNFYERD